MEKIESCHLFDGQPYIAEKNGKYHVMQGSMTADDVHVWYDTESEAVVSWNRRAIVVGQVEHTVHGITRDIQSDYDYMKKLTMW